MLNLEPIKARLENPNWMVHLTNSYDDVKALVTEIERLRTEASTTLIACERCGRGVPPKWLVDDLCLACATCELTGLRIAWRTEHDGRIRLEERLKRAEAERDHWHREADKWHAEAERQQLEADKLQAQVFGALQRIYGGGD